MHIFARRMRALAITSTVFFGISFGLGLLVAMIDGGETPREWMPLFAIAAPFFTMMIVFWVGHGFAWALADRTELPSEE
jgi:hypothetical protein